MLSSEAARLSPQQRSVVLAAIGGMMSASYLHGREVVDLSYGFPPGSLAEGALIAITGAVAGYAVLLAFRKLSDLATRRKP